MIAAPARARARPERARPDGDRERHARLVLGQRRARSSWTSWWSWRMRLAEAGAAIVDVGGESGRTDTAGGAGGRGDRAGGAARGAPRRNGAHGVGRHLARPGGPRGAGRRGRDDQRRERAERTPSWPTPAPTPAPPWWSPTRASAPKRRRSRATTTWWATWSSCSPSAWRRRARRRGGGADRARPRRRPGQDTGRVGRAAAAARRGGARWGGRCCWPCRARTSSARSPGAPRLRALAGTLAAVGRGRGRGRVESCGCTTWPRRATTCACAPRCAASARPPPELRAGRGAAAGSSVVRAFRIAQLSDLHCGSPHFVPDSARPGDRGGERARARRGGGLGRPHRATASAASTSWRRSTWPGSTASA